MLKQRAHNHHAWLVRKNMIIYIYCVVACLNQIETFILKCLPSDGVVGLFFFFFLPVFSDL